MSLSLSFDVLASLLLSFSVIFVVVARGWVLDAASTVRVAIHFEAVVPCDTVVDLL